MDSPLSSSTEMLMKAFDFNNNDLIQNRHGQVSKRQVAKSGIPNLLKKLMLLAFLLTIPVFIVAVVAASKGSLVGILLAFIMASYIIRSIYLAVKIFLSKKAYASALQVASIQVIDHVRKEEFSLQILEGLLEKHVRDQNGIKLSIYEDELAVLQENIIYRIYGWYYDNPAKNPDRFTEILSVEVMKE